MPWSGTRIARRSVALGFPVYFEITSVVHVKRVVIQVEDGEPNDRWGFTLDDTTETHAFRGLNVKPVVNGTWRLKVMVTDQAGCTAESTGNTLVTVVY